MLLQIDVIVLFLLRLVLLHLALGLLGLNLFPVFLDCLQLLNICPEVDVLVRVEVVCFLGDRVDDPLALFDDLLHFGLLLLLFLSLLYLGLQLLDEVALLVEVEGHRLAGELLNFLVHVKVVVEAQSELAFEFFLVNFGFVAKNDLVFELRHRLDFKHLGLLCKFRYYPGLELLQILLGEGLDFDIRCSKQDLS